MASSALGSLARKCLSILLKSVNSTFLGSTKISFSWEGCFLYIREARIIFKPTDLPWPVAPAISRWGILARSTTNTSLEMVLPRATGRSLSLFINFSVPNTERAATNSLFLFGTSIPIVPLPGIGAMIRIPKAAKLRAMSSSRFLILLIFTPGSGMISYNVTVGPIVALISWMPILKFTSVSTILFLFSSSSCLVTVTFCWSYSLSRERVGNW